MDNGIFDISNLEFDASIPRFNMDGSEVVYNQVGGIQQIPCSPGSVPDSMRNIEYYDLTIKGSGRKELYSPFTPTFVITNNFTLESNASYYNYTLTLGNDVKVNGLFTLLNSGGNPSMINGSYKIYAKGDVSANISNTLINNTTVYKTTVPIVISGSSNQTINLTGAINPISFPIEIASTGGLITPTGTWAIGRSFTYTSGTFSSRPNVKFWTPYEAVVHL